MSLQLRSYSHLLLNDVPKISRELRALVITKIASNSTSASISTSSAISPAGVSISTATIIPISKSKTGTAKKTSTLVKVKKNSTTRIFTPIIQDTQAQGRDLYTVIKEEDSDSGTEYFNIYNRKL